MRLTLLSEDSPPSLHLFNSYRTEGDDHEPAVDSNDCPQLALLRNLFNPPSASSTPKSSPAYSSSSAQAPPLIPLSELPIDQEACTKSSFDQRDHIDEKLAWFDKTVVWSRGNQIYRTYSFHDEDLGGVVSQACFAWFMVGAQLPLTHQDKWPSDDRATTFKKHNPSPPTQSSTFSAFSFSSTSSWPSPPLQNNQSSRKTRIRTLCIFLPALIRIYFPSGEIHTVHLPFKLLKAWPLPHCGLLIQRKLTPADVSLVSAAAAAGKRGSSTGSGGGETPTAIVPTVFILDDPFSEILVVQTVDLEPGLGSGKNSASVSSRLSAATTMNEEDDEMEDGRAGTTKPSAKKSPIPTIAPPPLRQEDEVIYVSPSTPTFATSSTSSFPQPDDFRFLVTLRPSNGSLTFYKFSKATDIEAKMTNIKKKMLARTSLPGGIVPEKRKSLGGGGGPGNNSMNASKKRQQQITSSQLERRRSNQGAIDVSSHHHQTAHHQSISNTSSSSNINRRSSNPLPQSSTSATSSQQPILGEPPLVAALSQHPTTSDQQRSRRLSLSRTDLNVSMDRMVLSAVEELERDLAQQQQSGFIDVDDVDELMLAAGGGEMDRTASLGAGVGTAEDEDVSWGRGLRSEIVLEKIGWDVGVRSATLASDLMIFTTSIEYPSITLFVHHLPSQTLSSYTIQHPSPSPPPSSTSLVPAFVKLTKRRSGAVSAVPILATRGLIPDVLILEAHRDFVTSTISNTLKLVSQGGETDVTVPVTTENGSSQQSQSSLHLRLRPSDSLSFSNTPQSDENNIVKLEESIGSRVIVHKSNGLKLQFTFNTNPRTSLVRRCLAALSVCLGIEDMWVLRREVGMALSKEGTCPSQINEKQREWSLFEGVLAELAGLVPVVHQQQQETTKSWDRMRSDEDLSREQDPILSSLMNFNMQPTVPTHLFGITSSTTTSRFSSQKILFPIILALHSIAEDAKMNVSRYGEVTLLAGFLIEGARACGMNDWVDYWFREVPSSGFTHVKYQVLPDLAAYAPHAPLGEPFDALKYLHSILTNPLKPVPPTFHSLSHISIQFQVIPSLVYGKVQPLSRIDSLASIYSTLNGSHSSRSKSATLQKAVLLLVAYGFTEETLAFLPFGVSLPLYEAMRKVVYDPPKQWPIEAYKLIDRMDIANAGDDAHGMLNDRSKMRVAEKATNEFNAEKETIPALIKRGRSSKDSAEAAARTAAHLATSLPGELARFNSDRRLAEVERILQTTRPVSIKVEDRPDRSEHDTAAARKAASMAISYRTSSLPVGQGIFTFATSHTDVKHAWPIPPLNLSVQIFPQNMLLHLDPTVLNSEARDWPNFHNGVAAGLRIAADSKFIDSSWIIFNKPPELNPSHGGFLFGLGLSGHLRTMLPMHSYPYLNSRHEFTSIGLLLGLAASYAGSQDPLITKVLSLHIPALLPLGSRDLNASALTQASALLSIGLLYMGSGNRKLAETAVNEIGRREIPGLDQSAEFGEAYAFSASMSFGMIMVGRGRNTKGTEDAKLLNLLRSHIYGDTSSAASSKDHLDSSLTAPGATAALGLMYLKSGREDIADILAIPQSVFELNRVRPDLLQVRIFARSLILWDKIVPTKQWINSLLPPFLVASMKKRKRDGPQCSDQLSELSQFNIIAGACFAIALKYSGSAADSVHRLLLDFYDLFSKAARMKPSTFEQRIRLSTVRSCLNVLSISCAIVMAGTGDLSILSRLRQAHGQAWSGNNYGSHMITHMAIGLLFLGGGNYTLGSSNAAIAAMVCAFFPKFAPAQTDNRWYPQAYRHLWALAVEPRCFVAHDVETVEPVYLPIKVKMKEGDKFGSNQLISPTLLPSLEELVSIRVDSPRYWPVTMDVGPYTPDRQILISSKKIVVKRKTGFLSYLDDPRGNRTIFVWAGLLGDIPDYGDMTFPTSVSFKNSRYGSIHKIISSYTSNSTLIAFVERFCVESAPLPPKIKAFTSSVLLECLTRDNPCILRAYIELLRLGTLSSNKAQSLPSARNLNFAKSLYISKDGGETHLPKHLRHNDRPEPIIRRSLITNLATAMSSSNTALSDPDVDAAFKFYLKSGAIPGDPELSRKLALHLAICSAPPVAVMTALAELVKEARRQSIQLDVAHSVVTVSSTFTGSILAVMDAVLSQIGDGCDLWDHDSRRKAVTYWLRSPS